MSAAVNVVCVGPESSNRLAIECEVRQFIPEANREDARWSARILARLPSQFIEPIKRQYRDHYQRAGGRYDANQFLLRVADLLAGVSVRLAWNDGEVQIAAEECRHQAARIMRAVAMRGGDALRAGSMYARSKGIAPPEPKAGRTREGCMNRLLCSHWWRRKLRARHGRAVETLARELNLVRKGKQCYASEAAVERRLSQKRRNRQMLEEMHGEAFDGAGNKVCERTLAELHDASVSNPELRRGELMCRLRGFEQAAKISKHVALFITVTAPGEYHRAYTNGQRVPHWNGSTPREVHQYLQTIWARTRAAWKRQGINVYGFRIAEPHHDGTPHWHLLAFVAKADERSALQLFQNVAVRAGVDCKLDGGGGGRGFKVERIDWKRGSAVGYVAKYIAKNIDGHALDEDLLGNEGKTAAARIDAWASTWGIRQFQQFGGPSVTVWRELRRLREEPARGDKLLRLAWRAADRGKWRRFCVWGRWVWLLRAGSKGVNRYGEKAVAAVVGIIGLGTEIITRLHSWVFERRAAPSRTRVNNCTFDAAQRPIMRAGP